MNSATSQHEAFKEEAAVHKEIAFMSPEVNLLILTWLTFILLLVILQKFVWKPILTALDAREKSIRESVENAEKIKAELIKIEDTRNLILYQAEQKSKELIDNSRKAAVDAVKIIQAKAREEAQIVLQNAQRDIKEEALRAQAMLRQESAQIAVALASKLLEENLDDAKNQKIVDKFIRQI